MKVALIVALVLMCAVSYGEEVYGLLPLDPGLQPSDEALQIKDMPPVRSQGTLPYCYAASASVLLDVETCRGMKINCASMPDERRASVLDLSRMAGDRQGIDDPTDWDSYPKRLSPAGMKNGFGMDVVQNALLAPNYLSEACLSIESRLVGGRKSTATAADEIRMWKELKLFYSDNFMRDECGASCQQRIAGFIQTFALRTSVAEVVLALSRPTYEEFLFAALTPKSCQRISSRSWSTYGWQRRFRIWPMEGEKINEARKGFDAGLGVVKSALAQGQPVMLDKLCMLPRVNAECTTRKPDGTIFSGGHSLVITGWRKFCSRSGNCSDGFRIQNSWGEAWQTKHKDVWFDARDLLDRTQYQHASLVWFDAPK